MSHCEHKTSEEYGLCNKCSVFERIARDAKALLEARKDFMDKLILMNPEISDAAQEKLHERSKRLEASVKFADDAKLWEEEPAAPAPEPPAETFPPKSCNRHDDCRAATAKYVSKNGKEPGVNFHCWSEDCEDCFGK